MPTTPPAVPPQPGAPAPGPVTDAAPELAARAASFVQEHRLPGAAVGVVHRDDLAWSAGTGLAELTDRQLADPATLYRVASITKTFTGTAIMQLRHAGLLQLDDPVVAYLPELRRAASPFGPIETVTIRRMLSHESGLASEPPGTDWATASYEGAAERTLARAAEIGTRIPPNLQQKYSNLAYQLLGEVIARLSKTPYPQYVKEAILDPLGMTSSDFEPLPGALAARCATGYTRRAFSDELVVPPATTAEWAEGGLWSSVADLSRWLSFQLRAYRDRSSPGPVLAAAELRDMHKPRYLTNDDWTVAWGISWYTMRRDDAIWIVHSGDIYGFAACACFHPGDQVGAIVLLNGAGRASDLALDLAQIARRRVRASPPQIEPPAPAPEAFRPLLGIYGSAELDMFIRLEWRDGKLTLVDPESAAWRPTLAPTGDPGILVVEPGYRESGELASFRRLADGRAASVLLASATLARLDPVT
jgi:CubicO group peptidase (beta-lactamase class C family)